MAFLEQIDDADREALLREGGRRIYAEKSVIIAHGDESTDVYFLIRGLAIATLVSAQGHFVAYRTIGPGDIFGELAATAGSKRSAWVHAQAATEICTVPYGRFLGILHERPKIAVALCRHLAQMVTDLTERVFERSALMVRQRLGRELLRRANPCGDKATIEALPAHAELAAFIGTHREAVTKELSAFVRDGLIRKEGRRIVIPSAEAMLCALSKEGDGR